MLYDCNKKLENKENTLLRVEEIQNYTKKQYTKIYSDWKVTLAECSTTKHNLVKKDLENIMYVGCTHYGYDIWVVYTGTERYWMLNWGSETIWSALLDRVISAKENERGVKVFVSGEYILSLAK